MKDGLTEEIAGDLAIPPPGSRRHSASNRVRRKRSQRHLQRRRQKLVADVETEGVRGEADRRVAEVSRRNMRSF
jgi:hypothetical protein